MLTKRKLIRVGIESTKGTAGAAITELLVYDPEAQNESPWQERKPAGPSLGHLAGLPGEHLGSVRFRTELRTNGAGAMDVGLNVLLRACGMALSIATFSPISATASQETCTIDVFEDGLKKRFTGCMGNFTITGEWGKQAFIEFEMQGVWNAPTDVALPTPSHSAAIPPRLSAAVFTLGGYTPKVSRFSLTPGNDVKPREDVTQTGGFAHMDIVDRDPVFGADPEQDLVANYDYQGLWLAGTTGALSLQFGGALNSVTLAAPKLQHRPPQSGDRGGKLIYDISGQLNMNAGDDEFTIVTA